MQSMKESAGEDTSLILDCYLPSVSPDSSRYSYAAHVLSENTLYRGSPRNESLQHEDFPQKSYRFVTQPGLGS